MVVRVAVPGGVVSPLKTYEVSSLSELSGGLPTPVNLPALSVPGLRASAPGLREPGGVCPWPFPLVGVRGGLRRAPAPTTDVTGAACPYGMALPSLRRDRGGLRLPQAALRCSTPRPRRYRRVIDGT